jgi:hypothetical protein
MTLPALKDGVFDPASNKNPGKVRAGHAPFEWFVIIFYGKISIRDHFVDQE